MPEIRVINPVEKEERKLRVAAYCRVSSDSNDQLNSFIAQVKYYTECIGENPDWKLADIYADEGLTGTRMDKRKDFNRLISDCNRGKIDRILTKSVSRFARNTVDCLTTVRALKSIGISIYFEKEDIDTKDMPIEMMLAVPGTLAQEESISISNNMRWSCQRRMQNGTYIASSPPYGYKLINGELEIVSKEAEIVRFIFHQYLSGVGKKHITQMLNNMNTPRRGGYEKWNITTINYILNNERYAGNAILQKSFTTDTLPFTRKMNYGEKAKYYVEKSNIAIISQETFDATESYQMSKKVQKRSPAEQYPLTGIIKCDCGYFYKRKIVNNKVYWECYNHNQGSENCDSRPISQKDIYNAFLCMVNKLIEYQQSILAPLVEQAEQMQIKSSGTQSKVYEIDKQIADLNAKNLVLARLKSKGILDAADFSSQSSEVNQRVNKLRSDRRNLLKEDENDDMIVGLRLLRETIGSLKDYITDFDEDLFYTIIDSISVVSKTQLIFKLIGGLELIEAIPYKERRCRRA